MSSPLQFLRRLVGPASLAVAVLVCAAVPVSAAAGPLPPLVLELKDPVGDTYGPLGIDLVAAAVTQDRATGVFKADLAFASDPSAVDAYIHVALGFRRGSECMTGDGQPGVAHLLSIASAPDAVFAISARAKVGGRATKVTSGTQVTITSDPDPLLAASTWTCTRVELLGIDTDGDPILSTVYDFMVGFAPSPGPKSPGQAAPAPMAGQVTVFDADSDAVPDSTDQCRDVPGAGTNGCPTVPEASSLVVTAKRLVVDRLIPRTGERCPGAVKITVTVKRRVIARTQIGVIQHGAFCHVDGTMKLRKRAKKARVTITGKGVKTVRADVVG